MIPFETKLFTRYTMLAIIGILLLAGYAYFLNITTIGIWGADTFTYWGWGYRWSQGEYGLFGSFRPVVSFAYGLSLKLFGINDYSIKILNSFLGLFNILLAFIIASIISRSGLVGIATATLYAFSPTIIQMNKNERIHTLSCFFVLLSLLCFIFFYHLRGKPNNNRWYAFGQYLLLILSGFLLGVSCHTHQEISLIGPGFILFLFVAAVLSWKNIQTLFEWIRDSFLFTFSFSIPFFFCLAVFPHTEVFQALLQAYSKETGPKYEVSFFKYFPTVFDQFINFPFHWAPMSFFFIVALLFMIILGFVNRSKKRNENDPYLLPYLPLFIIFPYLIGYSLFGFRLYPRLFVPFAPLILMVIFHWYKRMLEYQNMKHISVALISIVILMGITIWPRKPWQIFSSTSYVQSPYRQVFDLLKNEVNHQNRILVTPYTSFNFRKGFIGGYYKNGAHGTVNKLYFDKDFVFYISDFKRYISFEEILNKYHIRYIVFSKKLHYKNNLHILKSSLGLAYGFTPSEYSLDNELEFLTNFCRQKGATLILNENELLIYQLH